MTQTAVEAAAARPVGFTREIVVRLVGYAILAAALVWLVVNFLESPSRFMTVLVAGIDIGILYALIALGYTLVYGIIELINFAHGDLFMLGTVFTAILLVRWFGITETSVVGILLLLLTLVAVMALCALINVTAERVAYRRLRRAPKLASLITAVGLSFVFQWFGQRQFMTGSSPKQWPTIIRGRAFSLGGVTVDWSTIVVLAVTVPLLLGLTYIVQRTRQGRAMRATAQDQDAARLMGIDVDRTIAFTFALGGAMAGAAGVLYLASVGTTRYDAGLQLGLIAFTAAVLGGIGNLTGAVIGGVLIGLIQNFNAGLPYGLGQRWSNTVVFTILILLIMFKPEGLLGKATTEKV
jgi:branched-chain amino acid transport system permease protein